MMLHLFTTPIKVETKAFSLYCPFHSAEALVVSMGCKAGKPYQWFLLPLLIPTSSGVSCSTTSHLPVVFTHHIETLSLLSIHSSVTIHPASPADALSYTHTQNVPPPTIY
ncbi:hypothetical protein PoB_005245300 [Plakobranchus ocellatus]|uniref:Uncharacterized protein n=1 Tax=Plakobranchus ocellatus TaxID=259542 RepID=A0AAV4C4N1_9GAST|nr:hypothetical protein PoB_005245300 [Plakobranchus ocellatus]